MIEAVVWDLGGVVAHFDPQRRLSALADLTGLTAAEIDIAIWGGGLDQRASAGALSEAQTWAAVQAAIGSKLTRQELTQAWSLAFEPNDAVLEVVDRLQTQCALLTNNGPILEACLRHDLPEFVSRFSPLLLSWRLGAMKPSTLAFDRAREHVGLEAAQLLLIDDDDANVQAAAGCGWRAIQFTSVPSLRRALTSEGVHGAES